MPVEVWLRPWAYFAPHRRLTLPLRDGAIPPGHDAPLFLFSDGSHPPTVNGHSTLAELLGRVPQPHPSAAHEGDRTLSLLPFPLYRAPPFQVRLADGTQAPVPWTDAPERFRSDAEPQTDDEKRAKALMLRAEAVWDRIKDVDDLLADPARLWPALRDRWMGRDAGQPRMDMIVRHARDLSRVIEALEARRRRILRRVHRPVPVARVQEVDRRSMLWLARQPGDTLAERAGDTQRVLAVAREENFDTLENRVLRAYCDLANRHGRDYLARNRTKRQSLRASLVEKYAGRCQRLSRELAAQGVRLAEPGVTPNFVLQQNAQYRQVWNGWVELLRSDRTFDELWRWQARSWDEFCGLALMVAMAGVRDAQPVATSPIWFRDEHHRGKWIEADSPLGVMFLPASGLIVEVQRSPVRSGWGTSLWLRVGRLSDSGAVLSRIAIWPIWSPGGGLPFGEAQEVAELLSAARRDGIRGGIVMRPSAVPEDVAHDRAGSVLSVALGTEGAALRDTLTAITDHLERLFMDDMP